MGQDKASLLVGGRPLAQRIADELEKSGCETTVLGGTPLPGRRFIPDEALGEGPLAALRGFSPQEGLVFVASCDLPLFSSRIPPAFELMLGGADCVIPSLEGKLQPLCGLYRSSCWNLLRQNPPPKRVMDWAAQLHLVEADESLLLSGGVRPAWCQGANTPEELQALLALEE